MLAREDIQYMLVGAAVQGNIYSESGFALVDRDLGHRYTSICRTTSRRLSLLWSREERAAPIVWQIVAVVVVSGDLEVIQNWVSRIAGERLLYAHREYRVRASII